MATTSHRPSFFNMLTRSQRMSAVDQLDKVRLDREVRTRIFYAQVNCILARAKARTATADDLVHLRTTADALATFCLIQTTLHGLLDMSYHDRDVERAQSEVLSTLNRVEDAVRAM